MKAEFKKNVFQNISFVCRRLQALRLSSATAGAAWL